MLSCFARCFGFRSDRRSLEIRLHPTRRPLRLESLEDRRLLSVAPYVVNSLADTVAEDGLVTLREAIHAANTNAVVGDAHAGSAEATDVITFSPEVFGGKIKLTGRQLEITDSVEIRGPGAGGITIDANRDSRVFDVVDAGKVRLSGLSIENGKPDERWFGTAGNGGGIRAIGTEVVLFEVAIRDCYAYNGGGVFTTGPISIARSTIAGNLTLLDSHRYGGGVYGTSTLEIIDSTVFGNNATYGGGVYTTGAASVRNTTIAGNSGSAVHNEGIASLLNVTIAENTGYGIVNRGILSSVQSTVTDGINNEKGLATLTNSIVAGNSTSTAARDVLGTFDPAGRGNLIGVIDGSNGLALDPSTQFGTLASPLDPLLGPLAYNGGATATRLLLPGSPALDAGVNAGAVDPDGSILTTDQRGTGFPRVVGGSVDVGAVEGMDSVAPRLDFEGTTGRIEIRSPGWVDWFVEGVSIDAVVTLYADPDGFLNGNEVLLREDTLADRGDTGWTWYGLDTGVGTFTLVMTLRDGDGNLIREARLAETTEVVDCEADYVVNSTADTIAEDGLISLREALEAVNTGTAAGDAPGFMPSPGGSVAIIRFDESLGGTISLIEGELRLSRPAAIFGPGADALAIDAGGESRVLNVGRAHDVWLRDLTLRNGLSDNEEGGGGIYSLKTNLRVADSVIQECRAAAGGGIWIREGILTVDGTEFRRNETDAGPGGAIDAAGEWKDVIRSCVVKDCLFHENASFGAHAKGGAVNADFYSLSIENSTFQGNASLSGGAVSVPADARIVNSVFVGNTAGKGGAIYGRKSDVHISLRVVNSTLVANWATDGGGILMEHPGKLTLLNSILVNDNGDDIGVNYTSSYTLDNYFGRNNLIGINPGFVRVPSNGGDGWRDDPTTQDVDESANNDFGDLRLRGDSLAIDAGNSVFIVRASVDADGNPRVAGDSVDMGAYEFQGQIAPERETPSTVVTTSADVVDSRDRDISLREAIFYAGGANLETTVTFAPELSGRTLTLDGTALFIDKELTIDASSVGTMTIDAGGRSRVFEVLGNPETPVSLLGLTVTNGWATNGGGIYNNGADLTIVRSVIAENEADGGGGIYNRNGRLTLLESTISANSAPGGGGIVNHDGILVARDSVIARNSATDGSGGGIVTLGTANADAAATLVNCSVTGNTASRGGGAISASSSLQGYGATTVIQTVFAGNRSATQGGAIYTSVHGSLVVSSCTFAANGATENGGGAIYKQGELLLGNSVLYGNEGGDVATPLGPTEASHNLTRTDPLFVRNPSSGDDAVWGTEDDDYGDLRVRVDSPARDAGSNALLPKDTLDLDGDDNLLEPLPVDLAGNRRIQNGTIDMGAYEFTPAAPGDMNADGLIDSLDLDLVRAHWGRAVAPGDTFAGDANGDGMVNSTDLDIVRANWTPAAVAAAADAVLAESATPSEGAVYGPVWANPGRRDATTDFRALADLIWATRRRKA